MNRIVSKLIYSIKYTKTYNSGESFLNKLEDRLRRANDKGVQIVAGSDNYTDINISRGESSKDMFRYYFEAGMKPLDILQSSTYISAVQLKKEKRIGQICPHSYADIIAVKGDILNDFISTINNVVFIMKEGRVYKNSTE